MELISGELFARAETIQKHFEAMKVCSLLVSEQSYIFFPVLTTVNYFFVCIYDMSEIL